MTTKTFSLSNNLTFAGLSGDANPLHAETESARRLLLGKPIVHGMHLVLWALDRWLAENEACGHLIALKAVFKAPVGIGDIVTLESVEDSGANGKGVAHLSLSSNGQVCAQISARLKAGAMSNDGSLPDHAPPVSECRNISSEEIQGYEGSMELSLAREGLENLLPGLTKRLPANQIAVMLAVTRVIGMEVPGLNSLFREAEMSFGKSPRGELHYRVEKYEPRFNLVTVSTTGGGAETKLSAFVRPEVQRQASMEELRGVIEPDFCRGQKALVIGGSRGLGEVASKLMATAGAEVWLTYRGGRCDAEAVVQNIQENGGRARCGFCDVREPEEFLEEITACAWWPDQLFFFATPPITRVASSAYSESAFERYCEIYVEGFSRTVGRLANTHPGVMVIYYPSSVFIDAPKRGFAEYARSKAAGETLARHLAGANPQTELVIDRLPRLATDQSASAMEPIGGDPISPIMGAIQRMSERLRKRVVEGKGHNVRLG